MQTMTGSPKGLPVTGDNSFNRIVYGTNSIIDGSWMPPQVVMVK